MRKQLDAETFIAMYEAFMDADLSGMVPVTQERYLDTTERAKAFRKALGKLGLKSHVSVTSSKYGWVQINTNRPNWSVFQESSYEDVQEMNNEIADRLHTIWARLFPNIRNIAEPQTDYFDIKYFIN